MKKRIHISRNDKMSSEYRIIPSKSYSSKENMISKEENFEQILFHHKSSLDKTFDSIKKFQNNYFSKENSINKTSLAKTMLTLLLNDLTKINKERMKQFDLIKSKNENRKNKMKKILFPENEDDVDKSDDLNYSYINQKNELKYINFQIENEIEKTEILIDIKHKIYLYLKYISFYLNLNREIYCNINQESIEIVSDILKNIRTSIKKEFISTVKEKMETDLEINSLEYKIKAIKDNITLDGNKKYIDNEEIIYEDTKENNRSLMENKNKRSSYASLNKITFNKNVLKRPSNNLAKKHLSIDDLMKDNFYRNKLLALFLKNNGIMKDNKNQINNFLNINVNINLGCDKHKQNCSISSSENEEEIESKNDEFKIDFVGNDSKDESFIQTEEDIRDNNTD